MSKWIDFSIDERRAMILAVSQAKQIDEASAEKDWWVTAVLYAMFHTSISEYLLFKGGTSLSKGWNIINRFSEDIDLALSRDYFLNVKKLSCARWRTDASLWDRLQWDEGKFHIWATTEFWRINRKDKDSSGTV